MLTSLKPLRNVKGEHLVQGFGGGRPESREGAVDGKAGTASVTVLTKQGPPSYDGISPGGIS